MGERGVRGREGGSEGGREGGRVRMRQEEGGRGMCVCVYVFMGGKEKGGMG